MESVTDVAGSIAIVRPRATTWLLASGGVFVGHIIGYAVAHPDRADRALALSGHAYFGPAAAVVVPVAAVGLLVTAVRMARRLGEAPSVGELAVAQVGLFSFQELVERIPGTGAPLDAFAEPGVWAGLVAQVLVAWVVVRAVRATAKVVRHVCSGARPVVSARPVLVVARPTTVVSCSTVALRLPSRRGPPLPAAVSFS